MYICVNARHITHEISTTHSSKMMSRFIILKTHNAHQGSSPHNTYNANTNDARDLLNACAEAARSIMSNGGLSHSRRSQKLCTTPRRSGGIKGCHSRARGQRCALQLNIRCGHDTAEHVDLEPQLVKNHKATPEQFVPQPDIYLLISFGGCQSTDLGDDVYPAVYMERLDH